MVGGEVTNANGGKCISIPTVLKQWCLLLFYGGDQCSVGMSIDDNWVNWED